jgi:hypothetical protein
MAKISRRTSINGGASRVELAERVICQSSSRQLRALIQDLSEPWEYTGNYKRDQGTACDTASLTGDAESEHISKTLLSTQVIRPIWPRLVVAIAFELHTIGEELRLFHRSI